jgi:hypothetical protein
MNQKENKVDDKGTQEEEVKIKPKETINGVYKLLGELCEICRKYKEDKDKSKK